MDKIVAEQVVTDEDIELLVKQALGDIVGDDRLAHRIRLAISAVRNTYEVERKLLLHGRGEEQ